MKYIFLERAIQFLSLVDFEQSKIRRDESIVFLCGGKLDETAGLPCSVREALLRHLPARDQFGNSTIILAERATELLPGTKFSNLLDLEEYISAIVDGIVLIVESAGSICELGAFVKTPEISAKLIVLISNVHDNSSSFIKLGALSYFEELSEKDAEILPFHWTSNDGKVIISNEVLDGIANDLEESLKTIKSKIKMDLRNTGSRIMLTLAICFLLRGARISEINDCFKSLSVTCSENEIVKHLSILEICRFIKPVSHGKKIKYFIPTISKIPINFGFKPGVPNANRNTLRWISEISKLVLQHDSKRMAFFQEHQNAA